jgi:hypothetical protein
MISQFDQVGNKLSQILSERMSQFGGTLQWFHIQWTLVIKSEINSIISQIDNRLKEINYNVEGDKFTFFEKSEQISNQIDYYFEAVNRQLRYINRICANPNIKLLAENLLQPISEMNEAVVQRLDWMEDKIQNMDNELLAETPQNARTVEALEYT